MNTQPQHLSSLPHERALLSALLTDGTQAYRVIHTLEAAHFSLGLHQRVYTAISALAQEGIPVNLLTVTARLGHREALAELTGLDAPYLGTPGTLEAYAEQLVNLATRRALLEQATRLSNIALDLEQDPNTAATVAAQLLRGGRRGQLRSVSEVATLATQQAQAWERAPLTEGQVRGLPTGLRDLDNLTGGLLPGFYIVAGRPSMGKSALGVQLAAHVASKGQRVLYCTFEMSSEQLLHRLAASVARVDLRTAYQGQLSLGDQRRFLEALQRARGLQMDFYEDTSALGAVLATIHREHARQPLSLVIFDNLGHLETTDAKAYERMSNVSRAVKMAQKQLNLAVLGMYQLNRGVEQRADKRPLMSDLRDSGKIEEDADRIWLLYRDEYYNAATAKPHVLEIAQAKDRILGAVGQREFYFGQYAEVRDAAPTHRV